MAKWWEAKWFAWGELCVSIAGGGLATYLEPKIGIPVFSVMLILGIFLMWRAYRRRPKVKLVNEHIIDIKTNQIWEGFNNLTNLLLSFENANSEERREIRNNITNTRNKFLNNEIDMMIKEILDSIDESIELGMTLHPTIEAGLEKIRQYINKYYKVD